MSDFDIEDFDFGFTSVSEDQIIADSGVAEADQSKAEKMYRMIMPLLNNLAKDADTNAYIHWPNRKEKILQFKTKLESILKA